MGEADCKKYDSVIIVSLWDYKYISFFLFLSFFKNFYKGYKMFFFKAMHINIMGRLFQNWIIRRKVNLRDNFEKHQIAKSIESYK